MKGKNSDGRGWRNRYVIGIHHSGGMTKKTEVETLCCKNTTLSGCGKEQGSYEPRKIH
jgi:hypothetical protein